VSFDETPASVVEYGSLESVRLVREFLVAPERYLARITATPSTESQVLSAKTEARRGQSRGGQS